ncbi:MAG TPA: hypothetical protein VFI38_02750 [Candidatus Acidoferrum sp.]|nr:hypothetical protein [Candidatus Acidoferrum sp.]
MRKLASLALSLFLLTGTAFADSPKDSPKDATKEAAATPAKPGAANASTKTTAELAAQMEELRQALQAQQEQLQMLKEELSKRDRQIEEAREAAASANAKASEANTKAVEAVTTSAEVKSSATALNSTVASMAASNAAVANSSALTTSGQKKDEDKGPTTIRFKGVNLTPGGFIEAATVNRQRAESADINTPFNAIPFTANSTGRLAEMNLTARQSRLSLLIDTKLSENTKVTGYYEADFLGAGTTSNNRQSNSYVFRQRQLWGRVDFAGGWAFSAGQMWSLATENRKGIANRAEWFPLMIDPQYVVGYTWQRAYGARLAKSFGDKFTVAVSAEGPQATIGGRGFSSYTSATGAVTQNSFVFAPGAGGGLYNAFDPTGYSINKTPDFVFKAALDPGWGHYEIFAIVSTFQNRVYPCAVVSIQNPTTANVSATLNGNVYTGTYTNQVLTGAGALVNPNCTNTTPNAAFAHNDSRTAGGGGFHFHAPILAKKVDVGATGFYGDGTGRFGSAQLADATIRPDGTVAPIRGGHWLGSLEWHVSPKWDIYGYVGGEFTARAAYSNYTSVVGTNSTVPVTLSFTDPILGTSSFVFPETLTTWKTSTTAAGGYGSPLANNSGCSTENPPGGTSAPSGGGTCAGDTRYIGEGTLGFWHKIYQGEKGRVQWGVQYSYFYKTGWSGNNSNSPTSVSPHAVDNMVWTSFRYYLP